MQARAGDVYRVRVRTTGVAAGLHPSWLVGAATMTYPKAGVMEVKPLGMGLTDLLLRFHGAGDIAKGDVLTPAPEAAQFLPGGLELPHATVEDLERVGHMAPAPGGGNTLVRGLDEAVAGMTSADGLRLLGAGVLIGLTAWLSSRVKAPSKESHAGR